MTAEVRKRENITFWMMLRLGWVRLMLCIPRMLRGQVSPAQRAEIFDRCQVSGAVLR